MPFSDAILDKESNMVPRMSALSVRSCDFRLGAVAWGGVELVVVLPYVNRLEFCCQEYISKVDCKGLTADAADPEDEGIMMKKDQKLC